jgi:hypothetical protein
MIPASWNQLQLVTGGVSPAQVGRVVEVVVGGSLSALAMVK